MHEQQQFLARAGYTPEAAQQVMDSWDHEKSRHTVACKRVKVSKVKSLLPIRYIEALEQNQKIASCCRHPENHEIEAWYSTPEWKDLHWDAERNCGVPDIYIFHCTCGRKHRRVCMGKTDFDRPFWDVR